MDEEKIERLALRYIRYIPRDFRGRALNNKKGLAQSEINDVAEKMPLKAQRLFDQINELIYEPILDYAENSEESGEEKGAGRRPRRQKVNDRAVTLFENEAGWIYYPPFNDYMHAPGQKLDYLRAMQRRALGKPFEKLLVDELSIDEALKRGLVTYKKSAELSFTRWFLKKLYDRQKEKCKTLMSEKWINLEELDADRYEQCIAEVIDCDGKKIFPPLERIGIDPHFVWYEKDGDKTRIFILPTVLPKFSNTDNMDSFSFGGDEDGEGLEEDILEFSPATLFDVDTDGEDEDENEIDPEDETNTDDTLGMAWIQEVDADPQLAEEIKAALLGRLIDYMHIASMGAAANARTMRVVDYLARINDGEDVNLRLGDVDAEKVTAWPALYTFDVISVTHVAYRPTDDEVNPRNARNAYVYLDENDRRLRADLLLSGRLPDLIPNGGNARLPMHPDARRAALYSVANRNLVNGLLNPMKGPQRMLLAEVAQSWKGSDEPIELSPAILFFDYMGGARDETIDILRQCLGLDAKKRSTVRNRCIWYKEKRDSLLDVFYQEGKWRAVYLAYAR